MKLRFTLIILFGFSIVSKVHGADNIDWSNAKKMMQEGQYEVACSLYRDIYYDHAIPDYSRLNSTYIDDLQKTYSIDELELENKIQRNNLLNFVWLAGVITILVIIALIIYLKYQNKRIIRSQKELEEAKAFAEESIRNKSLLLSNMSHEIRTPLNALSGFSEVLAMEGLDEETRQQSNEVIHLNSELLIKLIDDIVSISCVDITNISFKIQPCEVISLGRSVVKTVTAIKRTEAKISFESTLSELVIETDMARLQQMLINLLVNATKFTKEGNIILNIEKTDDDQIQFAVTDTGCGIPLEYQAQIFGRFEKLHENVQGSGIGLSICQLIITHLGGKIWVDSTYTQGARFVFVHPLKQQEVKL